jgi:hypothetical protein
MAAMLSQQQLGTAKKGGSQTACDLNTYWWHLVVAHIGGQAPIGDQISICSVKVYLDVTSICHSNLLALLLYPAAAGGWVMRSLTACRLCCNRLLKPASASAAAAVDSVRNYLLSTQSATKFTRIAAVPCCLCPPAAVSCNKTSMPLNTTGWMLNGAPTNYFSWDLACKNVTKDQTCSVNACGGAYTGNLSAVCQVRINLRLPAAAAVAAAESILQCHKLIVMQQVIWQVLALKSCQLQNSMHTVRTPASK